MKRRPTSRALNVFEKFQPKIPQEYADTKFLFLANIHPTLQTAVRREMNGVRLTGGDTMNFWINGTPQGTSGNVEAGECPIDQRYRGKDARGETNLPRAAQKVLSMGPQALVIKHGEYGATIFFREGAFGIGHPSVSRARVCRSKK